MGKGPTPEDILRYEHYKRNPWAFLCDCVYTKDQVDSLNPVKKYPSYWPYLEFYARVWATKKRIAVPKSRRMVMSWTNVPLYLWAALFYPGQDFAFVSKKEDDAAELVKRAEFVYDHIPPDKIHPMLLPRKETGAKPPALRFPDIDSKIQGFPQGADQLRQFTFSGIFGDECAFWEHGERFYASSIPTTDGGGRLTLVSSRHPSFFQRVCYDCLDNNEEIKEEIPADAQYPLGDDSLIYWYNKKNHFHVLDIHYTANPLKRDPDFVARIKGGMPIKQWLVEYERNWSVYDGRAVYEDYSRARHESKIPLEPHLGLPLLVGWDFGLTPAAVVAQLRDGILFILREFTAQNKSIDRFAPLVMQQLRQLYPEWGDPLRDFRHFIDPAGYVSEQVTGKTCASEMYRCGLRNISAPFPRNDIPPRLQAVEKFLLTHTKEGAGLQLYAPHAPMLAKGFAGGYRYPDKYAIIEPKKPEPIKDQYSHAHDALQYLCGGAGMLLTARPSVPIPTPQYSFTKGETRQTIEESRLEYGIQKGLL